MSENEESDINNDVEGSEMLYSDCLVLIKKLGFFSLAKNNRYLI